MPFRMWRNIHIICCVCVQTVDVYSFLGITYNWNSHNKKTMTVAVDVRIRRVRVSVSVPNPSDAMRQKNNCFAETFFLFSSSSKLGEVTFGRPLV